MFLILIAKEEGGMLVCFYYSNSVALNHMQMALDRQIDQLVAMMR